MTTNKWMRSTVFSRFSYSCTVTDVAADGITVVRVGMLTELILDVDVDPGVMIGVDVRMLKDVMLDVAVDMLPDTDIIAMDAPAITLEFVVEIASAAGVLTDVSAVPITDVVPGTDVDILNDENVNGLAAVMTPLELTLSSP